MGILKKIYNKLRFNRLNLTKTLYINLKFLPFGEALKFPILVYGKTSYNFYPGSTLKIEGKLHHGMIKIGLTDPFRSLDSTTYIELKGRLVLNPDIMIRRGLRMVVYENGEVIIGRNTFISDNTTIACFCNITINDNTTIGNNCMLMDTDFHYLKNMITGNVSANFKPIIIGKNNWIGGWCAVKKGCVTPDFTIVAGPFSVANKDYTSTIKERSVIGGSPARLLKENVKFIKDRELEKSLYSHFLETSEDAVI